MNFFPFIYSFIKKLHRERGDPGGKMYPPNRETKEFASPLCWVEILRSHFIVSSHLLIVNGRSGCFIGFFFLFHYEILLQ